MKKLLDCLSGEWMLEKCECPNSGHVIFLRSIWQAFFIYVIALGLRNLADPNSSCSLDCLELRSQIFETIQWVGAIWGFCYLALYARFASQWAYLAGVYNKIKEAETVGYKDRVRMAEWKAAFLEDALNLHLTGKEGFATLVLKWTKDEEIKEILLKTICARKYDKLLRCAKKSAPAIDEL